MKRRVLVIAIALAVVVGPSLQAVVPTTSLVGEWTLDENGGLTASDTSSSHNDGTVVGALWTAGEIGSALTFNGAGDHVLVPGNSANIDALKPAVYTISAWVNYAATDTNGAEIVSMGDSYGLRVQPTGDLKTFFYNGSTWPSVTSSGFITKDGQWHHLLGQYTGAALRVYIDGGFQGETKTSDTISYPAGRSFYIGKHGNGDAVHDFNGAIDQVRVYSRALTEIEIAQLVAEGPPAAQTIKVLTWNSHKCKGTDGVTNCNRIADAIYRSGSDVALLSAVLSSSQAASIASRLNAVAGSTIWTQTFYRIGTEGQAILSKNGTTSITSTAHLDVVCPNQFETQAIVGATVNTRAGLGTFFAIDHDHQSATVRLCQATAMRNWADDPANSFGQPRIVGGDFNEETGAALDYWRQTYYDDWTIPPATVERTYPRNSNGRTRNSRIDHILSSTSATGLTVDEARVWDFRDLSTSCTQVTDRLGTCDANCVCTVVDDTGVRPTDHIPVTVTFRFP